MLLKFYRVISEIHKNGCDIDMFLLTLIFGSFLKANCYLEEYTPSQDHAIELINFLDLLNNREVDSNQYDTRKKSRYLEESSQNNNKIQDLIKVLQKNYYIDNEDDNKDRLHYISNPEVIDEYKANLHNKRLSPELYNDEEEDKSLKNILQTLRRNAVFRLNKPEDISGNAVALRLGKKIGQSLENIDDKPKYNDYSDKEHYPKKDTDFNAVRDTITKKYNWADSLENIKKVRQKKIEVEKPRPKLKFKPKKIAQDSLPYKKIKKYTSYGRTSIPYVGKLGIYEEK